MGVYGILNYIQYYLQDIVGIAQPGLMTSLVIMTILVCSVPSSIIAGFQSKISSSQVPGYLSERYGRKLLVYISCGILACSTGVFIIGVFRPSLVLTFVVAVFVGIGTMNWFHWWISLGYGAYQSVDWALALDTIPGLTNSTKLLTLSEGADIAKDMGVWHVSIVLPQVLSPLVSGGIITGLKGYSLEAAWATVFAVATGWFILSGVLVSMIRTDKRGKRNLEYFFSEEEMKNETKGNVYTSTSISIST